MWSLTDFPYFHPFLLSEVGWHSLFSCKAQNGAMASSIALFHDYNFRQELSGVCHTKAQDMISLRTRPLAWRGRSGHAPTFELSQGRNVDPTNDCH